MRGTVTPTIRTRASRGLPGSARPGAARRHPLRLAVALALAVGTLAMPAAIPALAPAAHAQDGSAVTLTKTITNALTGEQFDVEAIVGQTRGLVDRQQLNVELKNFTPSYNNGLTGDFGKTMQYPVVAMQCRGAEPTRETCASDFRNRYFDAFDAGYSAPDATQIRGHAATMGQSEGLINQEPYPTNVADTFRAMQIPFEAAPAAPGAAPINYLWQYDPSTTIDSDGDGTPDGPFVNEPTLKSSRPPDVPTGDQAGAPLNLRSVPIRPDGTNEFAFEARERSSLASLGCSDTVPCSLVLVPIMDMACVEDAPAECGQPVPETEVPGQQLSNPSGVQYRSPEVWHVPSNWDNRLVVPLAFQPNLATCDIRDPRPSLPLFGSELADVAQQRYGGAFCADARSADYLPIYSAGSEYEARRNFTTQLGPRYGQDAVLTSQPVLEPPDSPRKVVHAPTALTGFTVAFTIDDDRGQEVRQMTLNPRLLAKLTTQSYLDVLPDVFKTGRQNYTGDLPDDPRIRSEQDAAKYYVEHPDARVNPENLFLDPEFVALNPGLDLDQRLVASPVMLTVQSDVVLELSRYIASDEKARQWLAGEPDESGMRVNPAWQTPAADQPRLSETYTLRDRWVKSVAPRTPAWTESPEAVSRLYFLIGSGDECDRAFRTPYQTRLANITSSLEASALALLDRRGSATGTCDVQSVPVPEGERPSAPAFPGDLPESRAVFSEKKGLPSNFGSRSMISVTTVGHAELYRLPTAQLTNAEGNKVAPTPGTMLAALAATEQDPATGTLRMNHGEIRGNGYPGTMVAYTALPTAGMDRTLAGQYAAYVEFMTTTGQRPGPPGSTGLPAGYDPLPPNMVRQAADAAAAVRDQTGTVPPPPPDGPLGGGLPGGFEAGPNGTVIPTGAGTPTGGGTPSGTANAANPAAGNGAPAADPAAGPQAAGPGGDPAAPGGEAAPVPRAVAQTRGDESWLARWALPITLIVGLGAGAAAVILRAAGDPNHPAHALRSRLGLLLQRPRT